MKYMNDYDIARARQRFTLASKPNRLAAAIVVEHLAEWADRNSDGWCYWPKPVRAAARLIDLIESRTYAENQAQESVDATDAELAAAVRPVKAFLTREKARPEDRELILRASEPLFEVVGATVFDPDRGELLGRNSDGSDRYEFDRVWY